ncbi:hypothetical protein [Neolewinella agarilytica]|uniref:hypothetical protein n=1 Tax=Neolewinella agarilytica TaxID=478744 RepID=UPI002357C469|nr:hypothetical protein [Neolewinella agarilytica]
MRDLSISLLSLALIICCCGHPLNAQRICDGKPLSLKYKACELETMIFIYEKLPDVSDESLAFYLFFSLDEKGNATYLSHQTYSSSAVDIPQDSITAFFESLPVFNASCRPADEKVLVLPIAIHHRVSQMWFKGQESEFLRVDNALKMGRLLTSGMVKVKMLPTLFVDRCPVQWSHGLPDCY